MYCVFCASWSFFYRVLRKTEGIIHNLTPNFYSVNKTKTKNIFLIGTLNYRFIEYAFFKRNNFFI